MYGSRSATTISLPHVQGERKTPCRIRQSTDPEQDPSVLVWDQDEDVNYCRPDRFLVSVLHPSSFHGIALHPQEAIAAPTRSTTIALTSDEKHLVVVNREANSVSIIRVKDEHGHDVYAKLDEIGVGEEPRCVAVHPTDRVAYVTNGITGTVSVVDLVRAGKSSRSRWAPSRGAVP